MAGIMDTLRNKLMAKAMAAQNPPPEPTPAPSMAPPAPAPTPMPVPLATSIEEPDAPETGFMSGLNRRLQEFAQQDMMRRTGQAGDPVAAGQEDRRREGALMAGLLGPAAPIATLPVAAAGAGYEGIKAFGQNTGLGKFFPGPLRTDESTSPASLENVIALMSGFTGEADPSQEGSTVDSLISRILASRRGA